jgi:hypothetical protein
MAGNAKPSKTPKIFEFVPTIVAIDLSFSGNQFVVNFAGEL